MKKLGFVFLLALAAASLFSGCESQEAKERLTEVETALETMEAAQVYALCDDATKQSVTQEVVAERMSAVYDTLAVDSVDYTDIKRNKEASTDGKSVFDATVVVAGNGWEAELPAQLVFSGSDENMQLAWTPEVVLSGLTNDNTLNVQITQGKRGTIYARDGEVLAQDDENGVRQYPQAAIASSCVGYVRAATAAEIEAGTVGDVSVGTEVGRSGFEQAYQDRLVATAGMTVTLSDKSDDVLIQTEPADGEDITTTIDLEAQQLAADTISGETAAAVVVEPANGQVLVMAEGSSYDPTMWLDENMTAEDYAVAVEAGTTPGNGLFAQKNTPGSTQKLLTTLIGLNSGSMTLEHGYEIYGEDWAPPGGWGSYTVHRVVPIGGWINLHDALVYSDNIYFARCALDMGYDTFNNGMKSLGYGQEVPGAYKVDTSQITSEGVVADGHETGLADSAYGQYQVMTTPLQQALTYACLENAGKIMKPCYTLDEEPEVWIDTGTSQENIDFIKNALRDAVTVQHPSADASDVGANVYAKTGTAEIGVDGSTNLGWICGGDLDDPHWTACIQVNFVENRGGSDVNAAYLGSYVSQLYTAKGGAYVPSGIETEENADADNAEAAE